MKPIDVKFMKMLHEKVNIVPVIGKADSLTKPEIQKMKLKVCSQYSSLAGVSKKYTKVN